MSGVTVTKPEDDRYDGQAGSGESHDIVSFDAPDAVTLLSPLDGYHV